MSKVFDDSAHDPQWYLEFLRVQNTDASILQTLMKSGYQFHLWSNPESGKAGLELETPDGIKFETAIKIQEHDSPLETILRTAMMDISARRKFFLKLKSGIQKITNKDDLEFLETAIAIIKKVEFIPDTLETEIETQEEK